jgi:hypothetical protein
VLELVWSGIAVLYLISVSLIPDGIGEIIYKVCSQVTDSQPLGVIREISYQ